jgi:hypothetical protein
MQSGQRKKSSFYATGFRKITARPQAIFLWGKKQPKKTPRTPCKLGTTWPCMHVRDWGQRVRGSLCSLDYWAAGRRKSYGKVLHLMRFDSTFTVTTFPKAMQRCTTATVAYSWKNAFHPFLRWNKKSKLLLLRIRTFQWETTCVKEHLPEGATSSWRRRSLVQFSSLFLFTWGKGSGICGYNGAVCSPQCKDNAARCYEGHSDVW